MGKITGADLLHGMLMQTGWVLVAYGFARFMWNRGIRHYGAFGG